MHVIAHTLSEEIWGQIDQVLFFTMLYVSQGMVIKYLSELYLL